MRAVMHAFAKGIATFQPVAETDRKSMNNGNFRSKATVGDHRGETRRLTEQREGPGGQRSDRGPESGCRSIRAEIVDARARGGEGFGGGINTGERTTIPCAILAGDDFLPRR